MTKTTRKPDGPAIADSDIGTKFAIEVPTTESACNTVRIELLNCGAITLRDSERLGAESVFLYPDQVKALREFLATIDRIAPAKRS